MRYKLFIDDIRHLGWVYPNEDPKDWIVCRDMNEAVAAVQRYGWPSFVSFDHDLGDDIPTGYDFAQWLVNFDLDGTEMPSEFDYAVHSANPVGRVNIESLLNRYMRFKNQG